MKLSEILKKPELALPYIEAEDEKSFLHHYNAKMESFFSILKSVSPSSLFTVDKTDFLESVLALSTGLQKVLQVYLEGFPSKAFSLFKQIADETGLENELLYYRTISVDSGHHFFRVKKEYNDNKKPIAGNTSGFKKLLKREALFHVPFEKRKAIGTNRYSIPGFPCIYLSDSLHTSWSECLTDTKEAFHGAGFTNKRPLYFADLVPLNVFLQATSKGSKIYDTPSIDKMYFDYASIYPLILACHSKIKYRSSYTGEIQFRSEYIIPQLLLQWYREKEIILDGIRYLSCTADMRFPRSSFSKFNYVVPVLETGEKGYCNCLKNIFDITPVYTYIPNSLPNRSMVILENIKKEILSKKTTSL